MLAAKVCHAHAPEVERLVVCVDGDRLVHGVALRRFAVDKVDAAAERPATRVDGGAGDILAFQINRREKAIGVHPAEIAFEIGIACANFRQRVLKKPGDEFEGVGLEAILVSLGERLRESQIA